MAWFVYDKWRTRKLPIKQGQKLHQKRPLQFWWCLLRKSMVYMCNKWWDGMGVYEQYAYSKVEGSETTGWIRGCCITLKKKLINHKTPPYGNLNHNSLLASVAHYDISIESNVFSCIYLTNLFHDAVRPPSKNSQMTSKWG